MHRTSISEAIGDFPFYCLYGREARLPVDVNFLPPAADDLSTSVLDYRKRNVEKVSLAQNLARDNIQRSQQNERILRSYYVMRVNPFSKSDNVFGFIHQKQRRICQRNCCIIGLVRIELLSSRLLCIIVCVLKTTRKLFSLFMLTE